MSDLISRQAAIDAFNTNSDELVVLGKENAYAVERYLNRVLDRIKQLPPIPPAEPKRGKWERHYCKDGNPDGWQCDKCKEWYYFGQTLPNFCPNCGADMREVNHESN